MNLPTPPAGWQELLDLVCDNMEGVTPENIFEKTRKTDIVLARRMFCNLAKRTICRKLSQREIVEHMGDQWDDRSILSYYEKCHRDQSKVNRKYRMFFKKLLNEAKQINLKLSRAAL